MSVDGLNLGFDHEQSKRLVNHWHNMWFKQWQENEAFKVYSAIVRNNLKEESGKLTLAVAALGIAEDNLSFDHDRHCNFDSIVPECNCGTDKARDEFYNLLSQIRGGGET